MPQLAQLTAVTARQASVHREPSFTVGESQ